MSYQLFENVRMALDAHNQAGERQYRHNHYLKGSLYCGVCGRRLAVEYSRSRNGSHLRLLLLPRTAARPQQLYLHRYAGRARRAARC